MPGLVALNVGFALFQRAAVVRRKHRICRFVVTLKLIERADHNAILDQFR